MWIVALCVRAVAAARTRTLSVRPSVVFTWPIPPYKHHPLTHPVRLCLYDPLLTPTHAALISVRPPLLNSFSQIKPIHDSITN